MKRFILLIVLGTVLAARAEERVYLKKISGTIPPGRYELMRDRPFVCDRDTIAVPERDVSGLERVSDIKRGGDTLYVAKVSSTGRYEVRSLPAGVSYAQSIGMNGGARPVVRQTFPSRPAQRPFGWPEYRNPLERPAYR